MVQPSRGDVVLLDLDPIKGHEQGGRRPALVVSSDYLNHSRAEVIVVVPITSQNRKIRSHLRIEPPEGGLSRTSFVMCDQVRTVAVGRIYRIAGRIGRDVMTEVEDRLRMLLEL